MKLCDFFIKLNFKVKLDNLGHTKTTNVEKEGKRNTAVASFG